LGWETPSVTDRQRNCVGQVRRTRNRPTNDPSNHGRNLLLLCTTRTSDSGLHLTWSVKGHRDPLPSGNQTGNTSSLCGSDHRSNVVLTEDLLNRDCSRRALGDDAENGILNLL
jgi:hypothetical protein